MVDFKYPYSTPVRVQVDCSGEALAKQSFKDECDINRIVKKWQSDGVITHVNKFMGDYGDFTNTDDYQSSLNMVMAAQASFLELPAAVRREFDNDPGTFLAFVQNPANSEKLVALGLAYAKPVNELSTGDIAHHIAGEPVDITTPKA